MEKKRQRQWDKKHLRTVSTKLSVENFRKFSRYCQQHNTTPYRLMVKTKQGMICSAIDNPFTGLLYVDDIYGVYGKAVER